MTIMNDESTIQSAEIEITEEIQAVLGRQKVRVGTTNVTIKHPSLNSVTLTPSVYALYLAAIRAVYTVTFLQTIHHNPSESMAAFGYFSSMISIDDDMPWISDAEVEQSPQVIEEAMVDYNKCVSTLAAAGCYELID